MKHAIFAILALAVLSVVMTTAQTSRNVNKHYDKDGLAFSFPDGWGLDESDSQRVKTVTLTRKGGVGKIVVSLRDGPASNCDFQSESKEISEALIQKISAEINPGAPSGTSPVTTQIGGADVDGMQLKGFANHQPVASAVFSTRLNKRFVSLSYILPAKNERAQSAWNTVRSSLKVEPGVLVILGTESEVSSNPTVTTGVLNGRAIALPPPHYPKIARSAHASGTVRVQVTIDETGNVIAAHAVDGHPLLQGVSVAAAKQARFSPTQLCGEPVQVTGVITYNFVAQ